MKIKLDENLPSGLAKILAQLGHDADTITDEGWQTALIPKFGKQPKEPEVF